MQPIVQPPNTQILHIQDKLPLYRRNQEVLNKELSEEKKELEVFVGPQEFQHEGQERHILQAAFGGQKIPIKKIVHDQHYHFQAGYEPNPPMLIHQISFPQQNQLYDPFDHDYEFLDKNPDISEDLFCEMMTIFDQMFPCRYRNVNAGTDGYKYHQVQQTMYTVLKAPQDVGLHQFAPIQNIQGLEEIIQKVYLHFMTQRDKTHQPQILHMSLEHTHRDKKEFFKLNESKLKITGNKLKTYHGIVMMQNTLAEYVVARELLNCYQIPCKYLDFLKICTNEQFNYQPAKQAGLLQQTDMFFQKNKIQHIPVHINPVYQVMIPYKPYLKADQLKTQYQRTMQKFKDMYVQEGLKCVIEKSKKDNDGITELLNEIEDMPQD